MEYICPECNVKMYKYPEHLLYSCKECKITFAPNVPDYNDFPCGSFYINDSEPTIYTAPPLIEDKTFTECCKLYKLKAFL